MLIKFREGWGGVYSRGQDGRGLSGQGQMPRRALGKDDPSSRLSKGNSEPRGRNDVNVNSWLSKHKSRRVMYTDAEAFESQKVVLYALDKETEVQEGQLLLSGSIA